MKFAPDAAGAQSHRRRLLWWDEGLAVYRTEWRRDRYPADREGAPPPGAALVLLHRGVYRKHVGRDRLVADANNVTLYNPEETFRVTHPAGERTVGTAVHVERGRMIRWLAERGVDACESRPFAARAQARVSRRLDARWVEMNAALKHARDRDATVDDPVFRFVESLLDIVFDPGGGAELAPGRDHRERVEAVREQLAADPARPWRLADLATSVDCSPRQLSRIFPACTGRTLCRHLIDLRLRQALVFLEQRDLDLTSIALACGFYDHTHFTSTFRRAFGVTPSEVRRSGRLPLPAGGATVRRGTRRE